jgi:multimeric flavodoxin WrbA
VYLLELALDSAAEVAPDRIKTEGYFFKGKEFHPCYSCLDRCRELKGECTVKDDFQELQGKWNSADAIIYSVPVYHMSYPGQLHCFLDRLGCTSCYAYSHYQAPRLLKPIGIITQGSDLNSGQEQVMTQLIQHAMIMGCVPVQGDTWQAYLGAGGSTHGDTKGDAMRRLYAEGNFGAKATVDGSRSVGRRVAEMALILTAGALAWKDLLSADPLYEPILDRLERLAPNDAAVGG